MSACSSHRSVVLFYKYFVNEGSFLSSSPSAFERIRLYIHHACLQLDLKGRILLASEGINGTLSATSKDNLDRFIQMMELYKDDNENPKDDQREEKKNPSSSENEERPQSTKSLEQIFRGIDWKFSEADVRMRPPFPDLKISIVKEIVSSGVTVSVEEIPQYGGTHLSPKEFHEALIKGGWGNDPEKEFENSSSKKLVVIDVRNTFEHNIGHFLNPAGEKAINPEMVTFSSFDSQFCAQNADSFKDKKVLMYCTGGIRCEKASAMLKKRGVEQVYQLSGGIHRYLEEFPQGAGFFKGKNFVFDQRVAMDAGGDGKVGACIQCHGIYDEISGSRLCSVCRDLVLVCPRCCAKLREYHCERHASWKHCYFTFLEPFDANELGKQKIELYKIRSLADNTRNTRRSLMNQIQKIDARIVDLANGDASVDKNAPRRCRTCFLTSQECDGLCWGFWKRATTTTPQDYSCTLRTPIKVGDCVRPGTDWNEIRFGDKSCYKIGKVAEVKSWSSGGEPDDCVVVLWEDYDKEEVTIGSNGSEENKKIYRWGALDKLGCRRYDVELVISTERK